MFLPQKVDVKHGKGNTAILEIIREKNTVQEE
jgi:hypothetical protein